MSETRPEDPVELQSIRMSDRNNKGRPPQRLGFEDEGPSRRPANSTHSGTLSRTSQRSAYKQKLIEAKLKRAEAAARRAETIAEHQRVIDELRFELETEQIAGEFNQEGDGEGRSPAASAIVEARVEDWVDQQRTIDVFDAPETLLADALGTAVPERVVSFAPRTVMPQGTTVHSPAPAMNPTLPQTSTAPMPSLPLLSASQPTCTLSHRSETDKLLTRQSIGKDLPTFSGNVEEWPNFIIQYRRSTELCGFSPEENSIRLQKCLQGEAKDCVQMLLINPDNVGTALKTLERRFGRPEFIVEAFTERVRIAPPPCEDNYASIMNYAVLVANLVATIESLHCTAHLVNPTLTNELVSKLPHVLRDRWARYAIAQNVGFSPSIKDLATWLDEEAEVACRNYHPKQTELQTDKRGRQKTEKVYATSAEDQPKECAYCKKTGHTFLDCFTFRKLSPENRLLWVKETKRCFSCLSSKHRSVDCRRKKRCAINGCLYKHHRLIHSDGVGQNSVHSVEVEPKTSLNATAKEFSGFTQPKGQPEVLLSILPVTLSHNGRELKTCALLDEGSTVTLLDANVAEFLQVSGPRDPLRMKWTNSAAQEDLDSKRVKLHIGGTEGGKKFELTNVRTTKNLKLPAQELDRDELPKKWNHLQNIPLPSNEMRPTILIGQDNANLIVAREVREGPGDSPIATRTKLGWVIRGNLPTKTQATFFTLHCHEEVYTDPLHELVKMSFTTENFGVRIMENTINSREEQRAIQLFEQVTRRCGERWETGLLWRNSDTKLPESKTNAMRRLMSIEKRMDHDPEFAKEYCVQIQAFLDKGYARRLEQREAEQEGARTWYLPHFAATNPNKPKKVRLVFDAAAKSKGVSLNDALVTGPDLLNSLPGTLFKFREGRFAFTGDIKEMFLQIRMRKEDASSQRFLWRGMDRDRQPDILEMSVVMFGSASSPYSAQETKNKNAREFLGEFPHAVEAIVERHYMDDYLESADTVKEAVKLLLDVTEVHRRGGFEIGKWLSNSPEVLNVAAPSKLGQANKELGPNCGSTERVLGVLWNPETDSLAFSTKFNKVSKDVSSAMRIPTKREVLKLVMSLFDPLGFLACFIVKAKILLQDIWRSGIGWDDHIPPKTQETWLSLLKELDNIGQIKVPRCYSLNTPVAQDVQLHVFCDASEEAFAAVAYWRIQSHTVDVSLVMARTRVAPLKLMSIPRLELQAAVMATRLAETVCQQHRMKPTSTYYWTDSRTVLCWIRSETRTFKQFVAHRIGEILETTEVPQWNWVPTKDNVADDATRSGKNCDFSKTSRWWNGPTFLTLDKDSWPVEKANLPNSPEELLEISSDATVFVGGTTVQQVTYLPDMKKLTWMRLIRSTAWILRFIQNCKTRTKTTSELTTHELEMAEKVWIKLCQLESFRDEVEAVRRGAQVPKESRLWMLMPLLDENGILRVSGRLERSSELNLDSRHPIILDPRHEYTRRLLEHWHKKANHMGTESILNEVRQRYWIPGMRSALRKIWYNCQHCRNQRAQPSTPVMAPLPAFRVTRQARPFTLTGMDYFGPMDVTIGRRHEKRYGVLFTCLSVRAVHLEIAASLSTDSTIMAIRRFICRRGHPREIFSDNGTNLRGADRELKHALKELEVTKIQNELTARGIDWHFIPPASPHMGGCWERLVRSVKTALKATLKARAPKEEVLQTLMAEAENSVNTHPLTYVSSHPNDAECLTPNHFLIGSSGAHQPPGNFDDQDLSLRKRWRTAQRLADMFWGRWIKEYLPTLTCRTKWLTQARVIKVGDIGILVDTTSPRNSWPKGEVVAVHPGKDGQIRVVDFRTTTGTYRRPTTKIAILDVYP